MIGEGAILKGIELAWKHRQDSRSSRAKSEQTIRDAQELALRLWGSLMFETRANLDRIALIFAPLGERGDNRFAPMNFDVSDALMTDFCKVAPTPWLLEECRLLIAGVKRVDFYARTAAALPRIPPSTDVAGRIVGAFADSSRYTPIISNARECVSSKLFDRFNALLELAHAVGRSVFGDGWAEGANMLPDRIEPPPAESTEK